MIDTNKFKKIKLLYGYKKLKKLLQGIFLNAYICKHKNQAKI